MKLTKDQIEKLKREMQRRGREGRSMPGHDGVHGSMNHGIKEIFNVSATRPAPRRKPDPSQDSDD